MPPRLPLGFAAFLSFPAIAGAGARGAGWKRGGIGRGPTFETGNGSAASGEPGTGLSVKLLVQGQHRELFFISRATHLHQQQHNSFTKPTTNQASATNNNQASAELIYQYYCCSRRRNGGPNQAASYNFPGRRQLPLACSLLH
jgi:hypothetical protein